jgi:hypothetical protein
VGESTGTRCVDNCSARFIPSAAAEPLMRIVDTFPFSEPYEADLLHLKLRLGSPGVDEWVIVENTHTFQGEEKGLHVRRILNSDPRFAPYLDRIEVVSGSFRPDPVHMERGVFDDVAFEAEFRQRELARDYLRKTIGPDDWVLLSDCDECLDFSSAQRLDLVWKRLQTARAEGMVRLPRLRSWFDFDFFWWENRSVPMVRGNIVAESPNRLSQLRSQGMGGTRVWRDSILFEYSSCFSREHIVRKLDSYSHTGFTAEDVEIGLECAHLPISPVRGHKISAHPRQWLEQRPLTEKNSPEWIRENLNQVRTAAISPDYRENRRARYPEIWGRRWPRPNSRVINLAKQTSDRTRRD